MSTLDHRNATWKDIQSRLKGLRLRVYHAWVEHGPGTTREVSRLSGIEILTFRPRTTELVQLGLVESVEDPALQGRDAAHEGTYRAVSLHTAMTRFQTRLAEIRHPQLPLL
jgi:hypothetical protein